MAYYAVISESDELIPLSDLVFPVRIYFIVSDSNEGEQFSFPVSYYNISNQVVSETFNLPFVYEMSGKYFYSFIQNAVASLQSEEKTPTPTETQTETPSPTFKPTQTEDEKSVRKILALHGGGENPEGFRNQVGVISLMNSLSDVELRSNSSSDA